MNKKAILADAERFAKKLLSREGTGHDWWHIERVRNNARLINKVEKADPFIVDLAVILHDVGDWKVIGKDEDDYSIARNFLAKEKVSQDVIERVMFIIEHMSFSKSLGAKESGATPEFKVVQDADRLDAMGAIGIARTFTLGGSKGRLMYDPTKPMKAPLPNTTKKVRSLQTSTIHHFEEKLFRLKDAMNTKAAKAIARERHLFMKEFVSQFLAEWGGKK